MAKVNSALEVFNSCAAAYQEKFMSVDLYSGTLDVFCENVTNPNASILEIGCGPGNITKYILGKQPGFRIVGIDFAPNMLLLAEENNPEATFHLMDCRDISNLKQKFDGVICGFCLPYLNREETRNFIRDSRELLHNCGILYISTMEGSIEKSGYQTSSSGHYNTFTHYYSVEELKNLLAGNGFEIVDSRVQEYPSGNPEQANDLIIIAKKQPPEQ